MNIRITKYNPVYRNKFGFYKKEEWTCSSEIGKIFNGKVFSLEEYLIVEKKLIKCIIDIFSLIQVEKLKIKNFSRFFGNEPLDGIPKYKNKVFKDRFFENINNELISVTLPLVEDLEIFENKSVLVKELPEILPFIFRNFFYALFVGEENTYLNIVEDSYVFMGSDTNIDTRKHIEVPNGIFIEQYDSPHIAEKG